MKKILVLLPLALVTAACDSPSPPPADGPSWQTVFFDDHIEVKRSKNTNEYLWEIAIQLFDAQFDESSKDNSPVTITEKKEIGFQIWTGKFHKRFTLVLLQGIPVEIN